MFRRQSLVGLTLALALPAAAAPAAGDVLWRGAAAAEPCRISLVHEDGGVRAAVDPSTAGAVVLGEASELTVAAMSKSGQTTLTVVRRGETSRPAGDAGVELRVPPGCAVAIRTGSGAVEVEIGQPALPITVETVSGEITAWVDPAADTRVFLATSGEITMDYSVAIDFRYHEEPAKHGRVTVGSGATEARLTSRRGAVRVLRPTEP